MFAPQEWRSSSRLTVACIFSRVFSKPLYKFQQREWPICSKKTSRKEAKFFFVLFQWFSSVYFQFGSRAVYVLNYFMPSLVYLGKCSGKSADLLMNVNYYAGCGLN